MPDMDLTGPPRNLDAEKCVLGAMLISADACDEVSLILKPDDFWLEANAVLYRTILAVHERGQQIDETILVDRLKKAKQLRAGDDTERGVTMLQIVEVVNSVPTAANVRYHAEIVRDASIRRALLDFAGQVARGIGEDCEARALVESAEQRIFAIGERRTSRTDVSIPDLMQEALTEIDRRSKSQTAGGLQTGLYNLDAVVGGLREGELIVLAARPSMGKTALAIGIADHLGVKSAAPVLLVSLEMGRLALAERMLAARSGVSLNHMRHGTLNESECQTLVQVSATLSQGELCIDDAGEQTISTIGATSRRMKRRHGLSLVIVDYLQLIVPDDSRENREAQVAKMSRRLKALAKELSIPVLCLAQLNRDTEKQKDHKPVLSNLRESGAIEQDADIVLFVHREGYYRPEADQSKAEIIVAKNRNGPVGTALVKWEPQYTRFTNAVDEMEVPDDF